MMRMTRGCTDARMHHEPCPCNDQVANPTSFFSRLDEFIVHKMPQSLQSRMRTALAASLPEKLRESMGLPEMETETEGEMETDSPSLLGPMVAYRNIFQTDKKPAGDFSKKWESMNKADGWVLDFYDDARAEQWVDETFTMPDDVKGVRWAYHYMKRGVLKADFLRYLLPLIKGGVYSDTDVSPTQDS